MSSLLPFLSKQEKGMSQVEDMIGHNTGTALHRLNSAVAGLGLALQDARTIRKNDRAQMVLVARYLVMVDDAAADDEALADNQIKVAGVTQPTDLIANATERACARWLARGGVKQEKQSYLSTIGKNANEINDLSPGGLNALEARFLSNRKFAKVTTYSGIHGAMSRECRAEIRAALDGKEGATTEDDILNTYADLIFKAETVDAWISEEKDKRTEDYQKVQELKKACSLLVEKVRNNPNELARLEVVFKDELAEIRRIAAQQRAEAEAKANALKLTPTQRRIVEDSRRHGQEHVSQEVTDEDF